MFVCMYFVHYATRRYVILIPWRWWGSPYLHVRYDTEYIYVSMCCIYVLHVRALRCLAKWAGDLYFCEGVGRSCEEWFKMERFEWWWWAVLNAAVVAMVLCTYKMLVYTYTFSCICICSRVSNAKSVQRFKCGVFGVIIRMRHSLVKCLGYVFSKLCTFKHIIYIYTRHLVLFVCT